MPENARTNSTSIVARVPREILESIFENCLPAHGWCTPSANEAPLVLGRVCGTWRAVLLSTPLLWTSLSISLRSLGRGRGGGGEHADDVKAGATKLLSALHTWLDRAGARSIRLKVTDEDFSVPTEAVLQLVQTLCTHAHLWRGLHFRLRASCLCTFDRVFEHGMVALTEASIRVGPYVPGIHSVRQCPPTNFPSLTRLSWDAPFSTPYLAEGMLGKLTELSLFYDLVPTPHAVQSRLNAVTYRVLCNASTLVTLSLGLIDPHPGIHGNTDKPEEVLLPNLTCLRLRRLTPEAKLGITFNSLVVPKLHHLEIDDASSFDNRVFASDWGEGVVLACLERSGFSLQALTIGTDIAEKDLSRMLAFCPRLN